MEVVAKLELHGERAVLMAGDTQREIFMKIEKSRDMSRAKIDGMSGKEK